MPDRDKDAGPGRTGRDRLLEALRRRGSRGQVVAGALLAVLGFASVVQVRATGQDDNFTGARQADLIALINSLSLATDRTENEIADLQRTREALRDDSEAAQAALDLARQQERTLQILAGTVPTVGPGVRIRVEAQAGEIGPDQLISGLQELRDAGAEAIEVNDQVRVVAQTGVEQSAEGGLVVGGVALSAPYVLDVIGDPGTLGTGVQFDGGFVEEVEEVGGSVDVRELEAVEIASTMAAPTPRFAEPLPGE